MASISIQLTGEGRDWRMKVGVDGKIESRNVYGCSEAMKPLIAGLIAAELESHAIRPAADADASAGPSSIAVTMPSGRVLTFALQSVQGTLAEGP